MKKRKCNCSCGNKVTKVDIQRMQEILNKLRKLDEDDIENLEPTDCFEFRGVFCCRVDGRIICIE
ncbi:hypothetical protein [Bacillus sp. AFS053548]|uniref:hypothetical protein n=1 Tax=Bacillus sp. AFS053548 TaxID=2033505 RepID=UPI000BFD9ACD|nr:hypothetical protein [Bacillus sp. AFS053548]PGM56760.1 hypothetical protein CN946_10045 [Bacillus sp. AFS053548]